MRRLAGLVFALSAATGLAAPEVSTQAEAPRSGLLLQASGGVVIPFSVLGVGGRGEVRASVLLAAAPLGFSLSGGIEQHSATVPAFLPPPAGGFEGAALDNQTLFPLQLLAHLFLFRDTSNRLQLGAGYGLIIVSSSTQALGRVREENGVGHEVAAELTYSRRFGPVELRAHRPLFRAAHRRWRRHHRDGAALVPDRWRVVGPRRVALTLFPC